MNEETKGFKTSLVGGFNREDVLRYIEQHSKESAEQLDELGNDARRLQEETDELRAENIALSEKNANLLERLGAMTIASEKLREEAQTQQSQATGAQEKTDAAQARIQELEHANRELTDQVEQLSVMCDNYTASKQRIAEIELCAHRRAAEIDERAQHDAKRIRVQSAELISMVKRELSAVGEHYRSVLLRAQAETKETDQRAGVILERMDKVVAVLDQVIVGELANGQEGATERPRMATALGMMSGTEEK